MELKALELLVKIRVAGDKVKGGEENDTWSSQSRRRDPLLTQVHATKNA